MSSDLAVETDDTVVVAVAVAAAAVMKNLMDNTEHKAAD